jgi:signal transduction histidine kinase
MLGDDAALATSLALVCKWAAELFGAPSSVLLVSDNDGTRAAATAGPPEDVAAWATLANVPPLVAEAITTGTTQEGPLEIFPARQALAFPIGFSAASQRAGALVIIAGGAEGWASHQDDLLQSLGASALLAFELATVRAERDVLLISADRERIARDLHDLVIQRLFGAGLRLQGAMALIDNQAAAARVSSTVEDLDTTIKEIREAIFALESSPGAGLQAKLGETVAAAAEALGFKPALEFRGQPARQVPLQVQIEAAAVLREALSNAARHSQATKVEVTVVLSDDLALSVDDDGVGIGRPPRFSGIANARARAKLLGGRLQVVARPGGGTHFEWCVPLAEKEPG